MDYSKMSKAELINIAQGAHKPITFGQSPNPDKPSVICLRGINGRFPLSLHANQWVRLLQDTDTLDRLLEFAKVQAVKYPKV